MSYLRLLLFLLLSSCQSEKTELTPAEMWKNYTTSHSEFATDEMPEAEVFHDNKEDADRLAALIVAGEKKAGSSPYRLYELYQADLPKVGKKLIVTNFDGKAQAITEVIKVDTLSFKNISAAYAALDMGTTSEPLKKWKKAHWDFFASALEESGEKPSEDMLVVCEWFETIWPESD